MVTFDNPTGRALPVADRYSTVGRIHDLMREMIGKEQMSSADADVIHTLTMHPDLPDFFRQERSSPVVPAMPITLRTKVHHELDRGPQPSNFVLVGA